MTEVYSGIERFMFADAYNLFLKYRDMKDIDSEWEQLTVDISNLTMKYNQHRLIMCLTMAVAEQLTHKIENAPINGLSHEQWETVLKDSHYMSKFMPIQRKF